MPHAKRPRGRPPGAGKNDQPELERVADLMVETSSLTPRAAMNRVIRARQDWDAKDDSLRRRWQDKWQRQGEALMAAARARAKQKEQARQISAGDVFNAMLRAGAIKDAPYMEQAKAFEATALWQKLKPFEDPFMRKVTALQKAMEDSPVMKQLRAMEDSPLMKQIRAMEDSPLMKQIRALTDREGFLAL